MINEGFIKKCDSYNKEFNNEELNVKNLENYLNDLCKFIYSYLDRFPNFYPSIKTKKICLQNFQYNAKQRTLNAKNKKILHNDDC